MELENHYMINLLDLLHVIQFIKLINLQKRNILNRN